MPTGQPLSPCAVESTQARECPQAERCRLPKTLQPERHERSVDPDQGNDVSNRTERDQGKPTGRSFVPEQQACELVRDTDCRQCSEDRWGIRPRDRDECQLIWPGLVMDSVMVENDDRNPSSENIAQGIPVTGSAIHRHEERRPVLQHAWHVMTLETISIAQAVGHHRDDRQPEFPKELREERRCGQTIHIVVAEDDHWSRPAPYLLDEGYRSPTVGQGGGIRQVAEVRLEEAPHLLVVPNTPTVEDSGQQRMNREFPSHFRNSFRFPPPVARHSPLPSDGLPEPG